MNKQDKGNGKRGIEWCTHTWNPIGGCLHGCAWTMPDRSVANCYAEDIADRVAQKAYPNGFEYHYWHPELLNEPSKVKEPGRVFVGSMADVFGHWVSDKEIQQVLDACARAHWHTFQFLTKNSPRLLKFDFPPNAWVGVSVPPTFMFGNELSHQQQIQMLYRAFNVLERVKAKVRWMSIEPLSWNMGEHLAYAPIEWAVIGAASNGAKVYQPDAQWVKSAVEQLDDQGVKIFYKGNLHGNAAADPWREEFPAPEAAHG